MKENQPLICIIILNWNGFRDTVECINSIKKISYKNYTIVVVDNASDHDDANKIEKEFGDSVYLIRNESNLGFSGGNNSGIKYAVKNNSDFILLINNDTIVEKNFLEELINSSDSVNGSGIIGPVIGYYNDKEKIWSANGILSKIRSSGFTKKFNKDINSITKDENCTFLSGCCFLIKKNVIENIGLLDEKYFLYLEDVDYCWRVLKAGYKIVLSAKSRIYHKVNVSTKKNNQFLPLYYTTRNRLYFSEKNLGYWHYILYFYLIISLSVKTILLNNITERTGLIKKAFSDFRNNKMGQIVK